MQSDTESKKTLSAADLAQFTGTEQWFRHSINSTVLYTEGAKHVAAHSEATLGRSPDALRLARHRPGSRSHPGPMQWADPKCVAEERENARTQRRRSDCEDGWHVAAASKINWVRWTARLLRTPEGDGVEVVVHKSLFHWMCDGLADGCL